MLALRGDPAKNDAEWVSTIATVLSKKAPTEWTDRDFARFRHELRVQVAAFQRLVALHAAGRARGRGPFQSLRITITRPDGREHDRLVAVEDADRPIAEEVLADALAALESNLGSLGQAEKSLLACLGDRLLPRTQQKDPEPATDSKNRSAKHA